MTGDLWFVIVAGFVVLCFAAAVEECRHQFTCPDGSEMRWVETPLTYDRICVVRPVSK